MTSHRPARWLIVVVTLAAISLAGPWGRAAAQTGVESQSAETDRQQLYDDLAREVAALEEHANTLKKVARLVQPTVVHIEASKNRGSTGGTSREIEEAGSGVVIRYRGKFYVLTNRHVIRDARLEHIAIKLHDGRRFHPSRVWDDRSTDVAVMALAADDLIPARLGNSHKMEIGDFVLAAGSPFGLSHSVTYGIISAKGRRDLQLGRSEIRFQDFLQTDAAINPGNSGGPLINLRGEVIGINTAIASNSGAYEGVGFAIPIDMVKIVSQQLIDNGKVVRAFLGVSLDANFGPETAARMGLPRPMGAHITALTEGAPAAKAKLLVGDVILQYNNVAVEDDGHLVTMVGLTPVGKEVPLLVFRRGKTQKVTVRVGQWTQFQQ